MTKSATSDRRKVTRHETSMGGTLNCSRGSHMRIAIVDLSTEGFSAEMERCAHLAGRGFSVKVSGLESLGAELRWMDSANAGFRFANPLHPAVLDHVVRAHPATTDEE